ncbi:Tn3 family transposase [Nonomuraea sp. NPDC046570]|uniref:Tn3 family transposase n=1 Tax=Nonomuraea sp. NPDC046570 TaxID=3155255 RepID=UPI0033C1BE18
MRRGRCCGASARRTAPFVALFSHFIPCGVWEAVYIIEGLLKNASEIQPDTISPYITHVIRRFGNWILNLNPPVAPTTRLDLESRVLFAP